MVIETGFVLNSNNASIGALGDLRSSEDGNDSRTTSGGWGSFSSDNNNNNNNNGGGWGYSGTTTSSGGWDKYIRKQQRSGWKAMDVDGIGESTSSSNSLPVVEDRPFLPRNINVPKNALSVWYGKRYKDLLFTANSCFTTWHNNALSHERYFTSAFRCPVTGELFSCGKWGDTFRVVEEEITTNSIEEGKETRKACSIIWYRKKISAEHAAAARALDCLSFRVGGGIPSRSYDLCIEEPYMTACEAPLLSTSAPSHLYFHLQDGIENATNTTTIEDVPIKEEIKSKTLSTPKAVLQLWYSKYHNDFLYSFNSSFITWDDNGPDHKKRFTSIFKCPVTNELFSCGRYGTRNDYEVKKESLSPDDIQEEDDDDMEVMRNVSIIWYRKKAYAERAAAARAYDCFAFRQLLGISTSSVYLCEESPYIDGNAPPFPSSAPLALLG